MGKVLDTIRVICSQDMSYEEMFLPLTFFTGKNACTLLNLFWAFITANISFQPLIPKINLIRLWSVRVTRQNVFYSKACERNISHKNWTTAKWEIFCWQIYSFQFQRQVKEFCNERVTLSCAYMNFRERKICSVVICCNRSTLLLIEEMTQETFD